MFAPSHLSGRAMYNLYSLIERSTVIYPWTFIALVDRHIHSSIYCTIYLFIYIWLGNTLLLSSVIDIEDREFKSKREASSESCQVGQL